MVRVNFRTIIFLFCVTAILLFPKCSMIRGNGRVFPHDDTIPRSAAPRPDATFYNGNFFQYYPVPRVVKLKSDTLK